MTPGFDPNAYMLHYHCDQAGLDINTGWRIPEENVATLNAMHLQGPPCILCGALHTMFVRKPKFS